MKHDCFIRRVDAENADKWVAMGISGLGEAAKAKAFYEHMKEEEKLTDLKQKLMDAANLFISQYQRFSLPVADSKRYTFRFWLISEVFMLSSSN